MASDKFDPGGVPFSVENYGNPTTEKPDATGQAGIGSFEPGGDPFVVNRVTATDAGTATGDAVGNFYLESAKRGLGGLLSMGPSALDFLSGSSERRKSIQAMIDAGLVAPKDKQWSETLTSRLDDAYKSIVNADPTMEPKTSLEKYGGKAIEYGVSGSPFSWLAYHKAPMKIPAVASEIGSIIGGAVGSNVLGDIGERFGIRGAGEFGGGLAGGVIGGLGPVLTSKAIAFGKQIAPESLDAVAKTAAGEQVKGALLASPGAVDELGKSLDVAGQITDVNRAASIPGEVGPLPASAIMRPTLSEASGSIPVGDIERSLAAKSPEAHGRALAQQQQTQAAVRSAKQAMFPEGQSFSRAPTSILRRAEAQLDQRIAQIEKAQSDLAENVVGTTQQRSGEQLRALRDSAYAKARGIKNALYDDVYKAADDAKIKVDVTDIRDAVKAIKAEDANAFADMPASFRKVINKYAGDTAIPTEGRSIDPELMAHMETEASKPVSFKELHSLMKDVNAGYYTSERAYRNLGDLNAGNRMYLLGRLKTVLDDKVKLYESTDQFGAVAEKLQIANQFYFDKYRRAFRLGIGGSIGAESAMKASGERVASEGIVKQFFSPSGMDDFYEVFGANPEARQALTDGVLDLVAAASGVMKDGKINAKALRTFLSNNRATFEKLPDVRESLQTVASAADALTERAARLQVGQQRLHQSVLAKIANVENTQELVERAMLSKRQLMSLVSAARTPGQKLAVTRAIVDAVPEAAQKTGMTPIEYVLANEATLSPVLNRLGPKHVENLKLLAKAETILGRADLPVHAAVERPGATFEKITGTTAASLQSQFRAAFITRQQGQHYFITSLLSKYGLKVRGEMAERIQTEIVRNPELALQLVRATSQKVPLQDTGNKLRYLLMNAGIRAYATSEEVE